VKIFNWIATMWQGSMTFETPMLFAVGFIFVFTMGGFTGLILAMAPDRHPAAGHLLRGGPLPLRAGGRLAVRPVRRLLLLGAQVDRRDVQRNARQDPLLVELIAFNVTFFPMHFLGLAGMPRRYADYPMQFADFNAIAVVGAFAFGLAQVYFFLFIVLPTMRGKGEKAACKSPGKPLKAWNGKCRRPHRSIPSRRRPSWTRRRPR
jgi:cytochrome c oxidase subunit 1